MAAADNNLTEDIIKRRLLIDGDGTGDERKLNTLIKSYLSFVDGIERPSSSASAITDADGDAETDPEVEKWEESSVSTLKQIIGQAQTLDYVANRTHIAINVNEEAKEVYEELQEQVKSEIRDTKAQIVESKELLEEATKHRKYSMEYDALAKLIESKPDRKMQELKRMGLQLELDTLKRRKQRLDSYLNDRKRTIQQLGQNIEMVKEHLKACDDKFIQRRGTRRPKNGDTPMDVDSTSQSEPPSPVEQASQESTTPVNGSLETVKNGSVRMEVESPSVLSNTSIDKSKSEKYEDLSESEGDDHS